MNRIPNLTCIARLVTAGALSTLHAAEASTMLPSTPNGLLMLALSVIGAGITVIIMLRRRATERQALAVVVADVRAAAERVRTACGELAAGSSMVAKGATDQATQLLESSSSLEELRAMVERSSDNGTAANRICQQVGRSVGDVRLAMDRLNEAVREIQNRAQAVNGVLDHIREITTQTGLLAVNAGLEATRAGEAGRGFAVVASEVGQLATDARNRAQHISTLVAASHEGAELGAQLAKGVDQALQATLTQMSEITRLVDAIVKAGLEQARGMNEISKTVTAMDIVTQDTAASAGQMATNASQLAQLADGLDNAVNGLSQQIGEETAARPAIVVVAPQLAPAPARRVPTAPKGPSTASKSAAALTGTSEDSFWGAQTAAPRKPAFTPELKKSLDTRVTASEQEDSAGDFVPFTGSKGDP